ncbi:MAG: AAA family ATPase [Mycoplasmataceae bacterium]|jgi:chromosomal replication initiator protein|nr:AAA family ATPase [Mycoplasmataceae bacterium]
MNEFLFETEQLKKTIEIFNKICISKRKTLLYIYGNSGIGKTTIAKTLYKRALANSLKTVYIDANKFANEFYLVINDTKKIEELKKKYFDLDCFIIDSFDCFSGNQKIITIYESIVNILSLENKLIIIIAQQPFHKFKFPIKISAKIRGGLEVAITPLSKKDAINYIESKINNDYKDVKISEDVLNFIEKRANGNIATLDSIINKISFYYCDIVDKENNIITLANMKKYLKVDVTSFDQTGFNINPKYIIIELANYFNVLAEDIISKTKNRKISEIRDICIYLIKQKVYKITLKQIASFFSDRTHPSIKQSISKGKMILDLKKDMAANLMEIVNKL